MIETEIPHEFSADVIFAKDYQSQVENALLRNGDNLKIFEMAKDDWLENATILRAMGKPVWAKPIPPRLRVVTADWEKREITLSYGDPVADPNFDLPPLPGPNPPGVTDVGPHNWGDIWAAGEKDTMPAGSIVEHQGHKLERMGSWGFFGGRGYYKEVVL